MFENLISFMTKQEQKLNEDFLHNGYVIFPLANTEILENIRKQINELAQPWSEHKEKDAGKFLNEFHLGIKKEALNPARLAIIDGINNREDFLPNLFSLARPMLELLVGNELAMQRRANLSIQMPQDEMSVLDIHTDVWSGNSPFEVVFWMPLVDCFASKSMYLVPRHLSEQHRAAVEANQYETSDDLYQAVKDDAIELNVPYGHGVIFSHSILHGNRMNEEHETRWSFNIRFKSLLSPYSDKMLGETFMPIQCRAVTQIGYEFGMSSS